MGNNLKGNWLRTSIGEINLRRSRNIEPFKYPNQQYELYSIPASEMRVPEIVYGEEIKSSKQIVVEGDILISKINPRINRVWKVQNFSSFTKIASSEWIVIHTKEIISCDFLKYQFSAPFFRKLLQSEVSGVGGSLTRARPKLVENYDIYLAPLAEQKRIVAKLDEAFQHLETLKAKLERIPELLEKFRETVLTHAVTGKLTKHSTETWTSYALGELGKWTGGGTPSKSNKSYWKDGNVPWITPKDMKGLFLTDSIDKITEEAVEDSSAQIIPVNSILIVTRSGILRRVLPISMNVVKTTVNQDLKALIPKNGIYPKFVLYALIAFEQDIRNLCMKNGTTVESIEFSALKHFSIDIPDLAVQKEIVQTLETLLLKGDEIERKSRNLAKLINELPQALLTKAFKGELVPQYENEEPASVLLERIKEAKALNKKVAKLPEEFAF